MPYIIKKNRNGKYRVENTDTGQFKARNTTKKRAQTQIKLLYLIERRRERILRSIHKKFRKRTRKTRRQRADRLLNRWRRRTRHRRAL